MPIENLIIDVSGLQKNFGGKPAVIDVSLRVKRGEIFGFLGPNGSGKTTTIRMLCGLLTPSGGSGTCIGHNIITESSSIKRHVGYIPQFFGLYKHLTVFENLLFMAEVYGVLNRKQRVEHLLAQLGLASRKNQLSGTLSGGWKQRLSLAAALVHEPLLLLLDEPTASVDPHSRRDFWELMHDLSSEGMTILLSSHSMDEVERCHSIAYICEGRLIMNGEIKDIINRVHLTTWKVSGSNLPLLSKQLQATPGVEQVMRFYDTLHVSGQNKEELEQALSPYLSSPNFKWENIKPSLEEVFIWLSHKTLNKTDN